MYNQAIKETFLNDIMVKAAQLQIEAVKLQMVREILLEQLTKVNMEEISTLPATIQDDVDEKNSYIIGLYSVDKAPKLAKGTVYQYMRSIKNFITVIHKPLTEMDSIDVEQYLHWYRNRNGEKKNQNSTINNERLYLSAFFTWMRKKRFITFNPVEAVDAETVIQKPIEYLSREEMEILRSGCVTLRDRALMEFLRSTGVRVGECTITEKNNIDWNTGDILVYAPKTKTYRTVFLDAVAKVHLKEYLDSRADSEQAIFVWEKAPYKAIKNSGVRASLKRIAERAGMTRNIYPHLFRHTFGTWLSEAGTGEGVIADLLGHKDTKTTRGYYVAKSAPLMRNAHNRMSMSAA